MSFHTSLLPADDKARKNLPIFKMIVGYFPKALREVTRVCVANNVRYNPTRKPNDINWARGKSTDQLGSLFRHLLEHEAGGLVFEELPPEVQAACGPGFERVYVLAEAAWRALAALELEIEREEAKVDHCQSHHEPGGAVLCLKCNPKLGVPAGPSAQHRAECDCAEFQGGNCRWPACDMKKAQTYKNIIATTQHLPVAVPMGTTLCLVHVAQCPVDDCGCARCRDARMQATTRV